MRNPHHSDESVRSAAQARDLQARLYREIGISAVAAALRFTTQPEPAATKPTAEGTMPAPCGRNTLAA
ncbi:MAG TPA: hypothetical protein VH414_14425 [Lichenihabitans sp.]|jgi:hypothetical protein|nr:hypothetical protein [Lichenihabitans sp.]